MHEHKGDQQRFRERGLKTALGLVDGWGGWWVEKGGGSEDGQGHLTGLLPLIQCELIG